MFVLDSSVTLCWIFEDEVNPSAEALLDMLGEQQACAPSLWTLEVINVLIMAERRQRITATQCQSMMEKLARLPVRTIMLSRRQCFHDLVPLARRHRLTVYDATYLDLAMRLSLPLATLDAALRRAAEAQGISLLPQTV